MTHFVGILDGSGDAWGVRVPDLPGCHGGGATGEAAILDAISAAREWSEHRSVKGLKMPAPRTVGDLITANEVDAAAGESIVMIPLLLNSGKLVRANLSLDAALLNAIDQAARLRGLTRSAFIVTAAKEKIMAEA